MVGFDFDVTPVIAAGYVYMHTSLPSCHHNRIVMIGIPHRVDIFEDVHPDCIPVKILMRMCEAVDS